MTAATIQPVALPAPRAGTRGRVTRHPLASFFILAYAFTWLLWKPAMLDVGGAPAQIGFLAGAWGPAPAGAFVTWNTGGSLRECARPSSPSRAAGWGWPIAIAAPECRVST